MNMEIFRLINNLAYKHVILDYIMIFSSKYLPYIFIASIIFVFFKGIIEKNENYKKVAINTVIITVINLIINFIIGSIYYVDRPFVHNKVNLLFNHSRDASFPSDHASGTMSIAIGIKKYNRVFQIFLIAMSVLVGFSRVYVGHHYPIDIIGSYMIVFITSYGYNNLFYKKTDKIYDVLENRLELILGRKKTIS
ncbi:phosphatase PAP2 family protein [Clostridium sp. Mt-5]|uniref:Phosphatase PAP2 family protein n=1 Tax=Clostridium moutaii TaxID=3240932 RepID=A0ABV4BSW6_9CLOT